MKRKTFAAAACAALLLLTLTACEKTRQADGNGRPAAAVEQAEPAERTAALTGNDAWKVEFEKSLLENYGVVPDHYEDLGGGVYQVYVEIDGKIVPYVAVDSATGDYHG